MPAYVIFDVQIHDMSRYRLYMEQVTPVVEAAGGKYLSRGGATKVYEGDYHPWRMVLFEFPSVQAWEAFYYGEAYRAIKPLREGCSTVRLVSIEGLG